jgi:dTDP-4-amino-4,6-dideoxygalactose transaminase/dTDP-4-dehydrorhamnose 3,5-epimerase-like enzyme
MTEISFKKNSDMRGSLIAIDSEFDLPFDIKRIFYIQELDGIDRGFHAHKKCEQILVAVQGSFDLSLDDGKDITSFTLNENNKGVHIPLLRWIKMSAFSKDSIIMVICSYKYDETEYIRNYGDFLREVNKEDKTVSTFSLYEQTRNLKREYMRKVEDIIDNTSFVMGKDVEDFESKFANFNGAKNCIAVSSGCSALKIAIKSLNSNNPKVLTQANTYIAVPLVCEDLHYPYDIIDVDDNLLLDIDKLEDYLLRNTGSGFEFIIVVVHLYGNCVNWDKLLKLKDTYGVKIVEDSAQAHGSTYKGKMLGTFGDVGCFSFYPSKNLGALGEGGAIITNDDVYAEFSRHYRNYGSIEKYRWKVKGSNERMHNIQGGLLSIKLGSLNGWNESRRGLAKLYMEKLKEHIGLRIVRPIENCVSNIHLFVIIVEKRDELMRYLTDEDIKCAIHYPAPFYESEAYKENKFGNCPNMDLYKYKLLSLPMYPELSEEKVMRVCDEINGFFKSSTDQL